MAKTVTTKKASTKKASGIDRSYPVWVGNLHEEVTEGSLRQKFSGFGSMKSCIIKKDSSGQSKHFGYINFTRKDSAERAAAKLSGCKFKGQAIKTKGPTALKKEGHLNKTIDFRPLTDCAFFVNGDKCKHGDQCPYRHFERVRFSDICEQWLVKNCVNRNCPKRHPQLRKDSTSISMEDVAKMNFSFSDDSNEDYHIMLDSSESEDEEISRENSHSSLGSTPPSNSPIPPYHSPLSNSSLPKATSSSSLLNQTPSHLSSSLLFPPMKGVKVTTIVGGATPLINNKVSSSHSFSLSEDGEEEEEEGSYLGYDPSGGEDDDLNLSSQPESLTRLMSLEARRHNSLMGDEENGEGDSDEEGSGNERATQRTPKIKKKKPRANIPVQLEPVGLFWDIENCPVPFDKSAFSLANKMRSEFFNGKREAEFMCVCDITKERKEVIEDLNKAHVTIVHVNAIAKNAADDKLRQSLRKFANTYTPPATVVLVSGDVNFSPELNDLNHVHNIRIVLVHNTQASEALKVCAHLTVLFEDFLTGVDPPKKMLVSLPATVIVRGLPVTVDDNKLRSRISRLADNCGGKVIEVGRVPGTARVLFKSEEVAKKAQKRMNGESVYGKKITVEFEHVTRKPPVTGHPPLMRPPHVMNHPPQVPFNNQLPPRPPFPPQVPFNTQPPPGPPFPPQVPFNNQLPPRPPFNYPPHPSSFPQRPPPPHLGFGPPRPHPHGPPPPTSKMVRVPSGPSEQSVKFLIQNIPPVSTDHDISKVISRFTEIRLAVSVKCTTPPRIYLSKFSEICLVTDLELINTASIRNETIILNASKKGPLLPKVIEAFATSCAEDISKMCQTKGIPWSVGLLFNREEEDDVILCSNVVSLLKKYEKHWCLWESFKNSYGQTYQTALSEMMIQASCKNAVVLLAAGSKNDQVITFADFSPIKYVHHTPLLLQNTCQLLKQRPNNRILVIEFVEAYQNQFGPLPLSKKRKERLMLQSVLSSCPELVIRGEKPSTMFVEFRIKTPSPSRPVVDKDKLQTVNKEFIQLLTSIPSYQLPLNKIQQEYQSYFHKSIKVSDIIPGENGMGRLLNHCTGIQVRRGPSGTRDCTIVCLANPPAVVTNGTEIKEFREDLIKVLGSVPDGCVEVHRFPEVYKACMERPFLLVNYGNKKLMQLVKQISDVVQVIGEGEERRLKLILPVISQEKEIEELLFNLPNHQITLDRFLYEYERYYKKKIQNYGRHSKLINYLEDMKTTIKITGSGPQRVVSLSPLREFACEMKLVLSAHPNGLNMSKVVPEYKSIIGKDFSPEKYGKKKLFLVLEAIPDVVKLEGEGPKRAAFLTTPLKPSPVVSEEVKLARDTFLSEVTCLLLEVRGYKMSLEQLTERYYKIFKTQINFNQLGYSSVYDAIKDLPNVRVSGQKQMIHLITEAVIERKQEKRSTPKESPWPSPDKKDNEEERKEEGKKEEEEMKEEEMKEDKEKKDGEHKKEKVKEEEVTEWPEPTADENPSKTIDWPDPHTPGDNTTTKPKEESYICCIDEATCLRLCSEVHRLLLCHKEHTMTLTELCEEFEKQYDPANPKQEDILYCIEKYNGKKYKFKILRESFDLVMITLVVPDAHWKLSKDIQYLFVYKPTSNYTMTIEELVTLYEECYSHKLNPKIYASSTVEKLFKNRSFKYIFQLENGSLSLTAKYRYEVFAALACELLFHRGPDCTSMDAFMKCYHEYFGVPLALDQLYVDELKTLGLISEVSHFIKVCHLPEPHLTFTLRGLFGEQLRHLLSIHNNSLSLDLLPTLYFSEFHIPQDPDLYECLKSPLKHAQHIIHLAAEALIVWAPTGRPYPRTRVTNSDACSLEAPEHLKASIDELFSVPDELLRYQQMVEEPLPSISIDELLDHETIDQLLSNKDDAEYNSLPFKVVGIEDKEEMNEDFIIGESNDVLNEGKDNDLNGEKSEDLSNQNNATLSRDTDKHLNEEDWKNDSNELEKKEEERGEVLIEEEEEEEEVKTKTNHLVESTASRTFTSDGTLLGSILEDVQKARNDSRTTSQSADIGVDDNMPPSQGLPYGQFAGLAPQVVAKMMKESLAALPEDDTQGRVKVMSPFIEYFGDLSARELERVDGPPKPRTKGKRKRELAIRFPEQSTNMTELPPPPPSSSSLLDSSDSSDV